LPSSTPVAAIDLEIRVSTPWGEGGRRVDYVVHSPSGVAGFHQQRVTGPALHSPDSFQKQILDKLESLDRGREAGRPLEPEEIRREVSSLGHDLYEDLFPRDLRAIYREVAGRVRTLLLTSDEPWIPWEIVRPSELDDDDFLCMRFEMSRWLTGDVPLAFEKRLGRMLVVQTGVRNDDPEGEYRVLRELAERTPGLEAAPLRHVGFREAVDLLEGGDFDLLHFIGHGAHDHRRPAESGVELRDRTLRARHLSPEAEKRLRPKRPVVFFNSCQVGRLSSSLTSVDGWAQRWVRRCGCSVFLAPILSVKDGRAARFADLVYRRLYAGHSLGGAVLHARHDLRREDPGDLTWLAYSLYGAPNARVLFGDHRPEPPAAVPVSPIGPEAAAPAAGPPVRSEPRTEAEVPPAGRRPPPGAGRLPGRGVRRLRGALAAAAGLAVVLAVVVYLRPAEKEATSGERGGGEVETVRESGTAPAPGKSEPGDEAVSAPPEAEVREPAPVAEQRAQPPPFPLEAPSPGKVGIVVVDGQGRADPAVAAAVRTALRSLGTGLQPFVPSLEAGPAGRLVQGDLSALPGDGRTPWGAQYLLLATATRKPLPQAAAGQESFALTLDAQLVAAADGSTAAWSNETHTGLAVTADGALAQAAERCLRPITNALMGGNAE
jgi:hypothetical protein